MYLYCNVKLLLLEDFYLCCLCLRVSIAPAVKPDRVQSKFYNNTLLFRRIVKHQLIFIWIWEKTFSYMHWHFKCRARVIFFLDYAEHFKGRFEMTQKNPPQHIHMHMMFHIQCVTMSILHDTEPCVSWRLKAWIFNGQCVFGAKAERSGARDYKHFTPSSPPLCFTTCVSQRISSPLEACSLDLWSR